MRTHPHICTSLQKGGYSHAKSLTSRTHPTAHQVSHHQTHHTMLSGNLGQRVTEDLRYNRLTISISYTAISSQTPQLSLPHYSLPPVLSVVSVAGPAAGAVSTALIPTDQGHGGHIHSHGQCTAPALSGEAVHTAFSCQYPQWSVQPARYGLLRYPSGTGRPKLVAFWKSQPVPSVARARGTRQLFKLSLRYISLPLPNYSVPHIHQGEQEHNH